MNGNLCRQVRQEIDQTELRASLSAGSQAHVQSCAECAGFRDERLRLREIIGGLRPVTAPADFEMRLRARIARERDLPKQSFIFRLVTSTPAIVVTAVLVIVVGAIVFMSQQSRLQNSTIASTDNANKVVSSSQTPLIATDEQPRPAPPSNAGAGDNAPKPQQSPMVVKNTPKQSAPATSPQRVEDLTVRAAQRVMTIDRAGEVSLTAPTKPMILTMYDEHGGTRKIQLPPISFGSQRLTGNRTQVSMTNSKDW